MTMHSIKKAIILFFFISFNLSHSQQIIELYSAAEPFYKDGEQGLLLDMIRIAKENDMQPCPVEEAYSPSVLVNVNSKINFVQDFDSLNIAKNKCAFDFTKKILPHLKNWKVLNRKGANYPAIAKFKVQPFFIYHSEIDPTKNKTTLPVFPKGINNFRQYVGDIFSRELKENKRTSYSLTFVIDENGDMKDVDIVVYPVQKMKNKDELIRQILKMSGKWKPATFNNANIKYSMRLPLLQEFNMSWEKQIQEEKSKLFQNK